MDLILCEQHIENSFYFETFSCVCVCVGMENPQY